MPTAPLRRARALAACLFALTAGGLMPPPTPAAAQPVAPPKPAAPDEAAAAPDAIREAIEAAVAHIDRRRAALRVPGAAVVVVRGDEVVLARGLGLAELEGERAVTAQTRFCIGSTTKAFTGALLAALRDDGVLTLDDPVTEHLPWLTWPVDGAAPGDVTLRDLLTHRTGFTRMGLLWYGNDATRRQVLEASVHAEPMAPFREAWLYNNVAYAAAGEAAAVAAGRDEPDGYEALLRERLLEPMGMDALIDFDRVLADEGRARPYTLTPPFGLPRETTAVDLTSIAPAGALYASADDLGRWLRTLLNGGEIDGTRVLDAASVDELFAPVVDTGAGAEYALGWMVLRMHGERVVMHDGSIDGYVAQVVLLPDADGGAGVGYAIVCNTQHTMLPAEVMPMMIESLLPADAGAGPTTEPGAFDAYVGRYHADFGAWSDDFFTVRVDDDGRLAVDVPGQRLYALHPPDDEGRWSFRLTDTIALSFERAGGEDDAGEVVAMRMHQGGATFVLPREGVAQPGDEALAAMDLSRFDGAYEWAAQGVSFVVESGEGEIALTVPGQGRFPLRAPDDEGWWRLRASDDVRLRFVEDDAGAVTGLRFVQGAMDEVFPRVGGAAEPTGDPLPTLDAVFGGTAGAALLAGGPFELAGTVRMRGTGLVGGYTLIGNPAHGRYADALDFSDIDGVDFGGVWTRTTGTRRWTRVGNRPPAASFVSGFDRLTDPAVMLGDWREHADDVRVVGRRAVDGVDCVVVEMRFGAIQSAVTGCFDTERFELQQLEGTAVNPQLGGVAVTVRLHDYAPLPGADGDDGPRVPMRWTSQNVHAGVVEVTVDAWRTSGVEADDAAFDLTEGLDG